MRFSDDKINHLSHVLVAKVKDNPDVEFFADDNEVRLTIKDALVESFRLFDQLEDKVRETLISYSRKIIEGSREWDLMYTKTYEQEIKKLKGV